MGRLLLPLQLVILYWTVFFMILLLHGRLEINFPLLFPCQVMAAGNITGAGIGQWHMNMLYLISK